MNRERQGFHISHVCIFWQDLSHHTIIFDLVTLTLKFTNFSKTLTWVMIYKPWEIGLSYFTCVFLGTRPFISYHNFDLVTLTLNFESQIQNVAFHIWLPLGELCCLLKTLVIYLYNRQPVDGSNYDGDDWWPSLFSIITSQYHILKQ